MADIMGITMKKVKKLNTSDGQAVTGDIYFIIGGKTQRIGEVEDEGRGGEMGVFIDAPYSDQFEEIYNAYYEKYPDLEYLMSKDMFIYDLLHLQEIEKAFINASKKGCSILIDLRYSKRGQEIEEKPRLRHQVDQYLIVSPLSPDSVKREAQIKVALDDVLKKYEPVDYTIYRSLDEFSIS